MSFDRIVDRFVPRVEILLFVEIFKERSIFGKNNFPEQASAITSFFHCLAQTFRSAPMERTSSSFDWRWKATKAAKWVRSLVDGFSPRSQSMELFVAFQHHSLAEFFSRLFIFERSLHFFYLRFKSNVSLLLFFSFDGCVRTELASIRPRSNDTIRLRPYPVEMRCVYGILRGVLTRSVLLPCESYDTYQYDGFYTLTRLSYGARRAA